MDIQNELPALYEYLYSAAWIAKRHPGMRGHLMYIAGCAHTARQLYVEARKTGRWDKVVAGLEVTASAARARLCLMRHIVFMRRVGSVVVAREAWVTYPDAGAEAKPVSAERILSGRWNTLQLRDGEQVIEKITWTCMYTDNGCGVFKYTVSDRNGTLLREFSSREVLVEYVQGRPGNWEALI